MKLMLLLASCLGLFALVGCNSGPYVEGYFYTPHPVVADIPATQPSQPPPVTGYATIVGIRRPDDKLHVPLSVEVRLRIDNTGTDVLTFDPRSLMLTTGDLVQFLPPVIDSPPQLTFGPGQSVLVTANFPFPNDRPYDQFDLSSLQLRWGLQIGPQPVAQIADFRRAAYAYPPDYYYGPYYGYYGYPYPVVTGAVIIGGRGRWR